MMVGYNPRERELSYGAQVAAGSVSGMLTRALSQPIDVLKIRFQLQVEPISKKSPLSKYQGSLHSIKTIFVEESWTAFWKGHLAAQGLSAVYMAVEFSSFEMLTKYLYINYSGDQNKSIQHFISGAAAGTLATVVSYPLDIVRTRFVAQGNDKVYTSFHQAFSHIYKTDGMRGYYRGLLAAVSHSAPQASLYFGFYQLFKRSSERLRLDSSHDSVTASIGATAGVTAKLITYPLDTTKRRLQVIGFEQARQEFGATRCYKGIFNQISTALKEEGVRGLYKGASWSLLKSGWSTSLYFYIYEKACTIMRNRAIDDY